MYTFGDFNHELDYILINNFEKHIFSPRLLNRENWFSNKKNQSKTVKKWNKVDLNMNKMLNIKFVGIINIENCCFLNASLQVLLNNASFVSCINMYNNKGKTIDSSVINTLLEYSKQMSVSSTIEYHTINNDSITYYGNKLKTISPCLSLVPLLGFSKNEHEDAEEFITKLLTNVHEDLLKCTAKDAEEQEVKVNDREELNDEWVEVGRGGKNMSPGREDGGEMSSETVLSRLLGGKITEKVTKKGSTKNATVTPFFILPLNIHCKEIFDVESALCSLTRIEKLPDWSDRQMQISQLPTLLIIQLKRFTYVKNVGTQKIMKHIKLVDIVTVPQQCLHPTLRGSSQSSYKLCAVIFHLGGSVLKGHYTAAVRDNEDDSSWLYLDDGNVSRVRGEKATQWLLNSEEADIPSTLLQSLDLRGSAPSRSCVSGASRTPYLLFYTRL